LIHDYFQDCKVIESIWTKNQFPNTIKKGCSLSFG
jgi:hypothetical protein